MGVIELTITDPGRSFRHELSLALEVKGARAYGLCTRSGDTVQLRFLAQTAVTGAVEEAISACSSVTGFHAPARFLQWQPRCTLPLWLYVRGDESPQTYSVAVVTLTPDPQVNEPNDGTSVPSRVHQAHIIHVRKDSHILRRVTSVADAMYCGLPEDDLFFARSWTLGMEAQVHGMFDRYDFFVTWAVVGPRLVLLPVIVNQAPSVKAEILRWHTACTPASTAHCQHLIRALVVRKYMTFVARGIAAKPGDRWTDFSAAQKCPWYPAAPLLRGPPAEDPQSDVPM